MTLETTPDQREGIRLDGLYRLVEGSLDERSPLLAADEMHVRLCRDINTLKAQADVLAGLLEARSRRIHDQPFHIGPERPPWSLCPLSPCISDRRALAAYRESVGEKP